MPLPFLRSFHLPLAAALLLGTTGCSSLAFEYFGARNERTESPDGGTTSEPCANGALDEGESDVDCGGACGPCANGKECLSGSDCASGRCESGHCERQTSCEPESDAQLCGRLGKACGELRALDNCGETRTVTSCGTCGSGRSCNGQNVCEATCVPESDRQFCARLGKACGEVEGFDNCDRSRRVPSCGSCSGPDSCGGGGTANQCGCTPTSCAAQGKNCGELPDGCGGTLVCGSCPAGQSCGSGGQPNVCACVPESDQAFCQRLGKACGAATAQDTCGRPRTVASCGSCSGYDSCGGGGTANQCGCTPTSCEDEAWSCGRLDDGCGGTLSCGSCGANASCNGSGDCLCNAGYLGDGVTCWPIAQLSVSALHGCRLKSDRSLSCWGENGFGQLGTGDTYSRTGLVTVPGSFISVAAGGLVSSDSSSPGGHTCAVKSDGTLWCWGLNTWGQVGDGTSSTRPSPTRVGTDNRWSKVAAGKSHSCAVKTDGTLWCWGDNASHQVSGDSSTTREYLAPLRVGIAADWESVRAGPYHTCAMKRGGAVFCWGENLGGQAGNPSGAAVLVPPVQLTPAGPYAQVAPGVAATCAVQKSGALWCWEKGAVRQVGSATDWLSVSVGGDDVHCGLRGSGAGAGTLWCWGNNTFGQLGNDSAAAQTAPVQVGTASDWAAVAVGTTHVCAMTQAGALYCWGDNRKGQTGLGLPDAWTPVQVGSGTSWSQVATRANFTCAVKQDGTLWCWGTNGSGQLGTGTTRASSVPVQVPAFSVGVTQVAAGDGHTCALVQGSPWCWGDNYDGQVGDGTTTDRQTPVQLLPGTSWKRVSTGDYHSCAVKQDDSLWCWGDNGDGQLGLGTTVNQPVPRQVGTSRGWKAVEASDRRTCALWSDGGLWCWGNNDNGVLGLGTTGLQTSPRQVGTGLYKSISMGTQHACAIRTDDSLWCWGANNGGQLGDATTTNRSVPTRIGTRTWRSVSTGKGTSRTCGVWGDGSLACWGYKFDGVSTVSDASWVGALVAGGVWDSVELGTNHACARKSDGTLWCWGDNDFGQLGNGAAWSSKPTLVAP